MVTIAKSIYLDSHIAAWSQEPWWSLWPTEAKNPDGCHCWLKTRTLVFKNLDGQHCWLRWRTMIAHHWWPRSRSVVVNIALKVNTCHGHHWFEGQYVPWLPLVWRSLLAMVTVGLKVNTSHSYHLFEGQYFLWLPLVWRSTTLILFTIALKVKQTLV